MIATQPRRVLPLLAALAAVGFLDSCTSWWPGKDDLLYCDPTTPCTDRTQYCDFIKHECVATPVDGGPDGLVSCVSNKDCPNAIPMCQAPACRPCTPGTDGNSLCLSRSNTTPFCDATSGGCRGCQSHSECSSGACLPDGSCAPESQVAFVDNGNQAPDTCKMSGTHDGSAQHPFCDLQDALPGTSLKPYVVVVGSAAAYGTVTIADQKVTLLGPGLHSEPTATISPVQGTAAVVVNGNGAQVVLDGFDVTGATMTRPGVSCAPSGAATLTVTRCFIHDNAGGGVSATNNCNITLDMNVLTSNPGTGINISQSHFTITNNIIGHNGYGSDTFGVSFGLQSDGTFAFNTVTQNGSVTFPGGIYCGNPNITQDIAASIVASNGVSKATSSQFAGNCNLVNVVTGTGSNDSGTKLDPAFVNTASPYDFHLSMASQSDIGANLACCVDQIKVPPTTANAYHDVDFRLRPKGAGWDIGAHEVQ